jgi:hypothetical protein
MTFKESDRRVYRRRGHRSYAPARFPVLHDFEPIVNFELEPVAQTTASAGSQGVSSSALILGSEVVMSGFRPQLRPLAGPSLPAPPLRVAPCGIVDDQVDGTQRTSGQGIGGNEEISAQQHAAMPTIANGVKVHDGELRISDRGLGPHYEVFNG